MELPRIFGDNGAFIEPSPEVIAQLDAPTRARLDAVRTAYNNLLAAQAAEKAATDEVQNALQAIEDAEAYRKRHYPPQSQHDLWIETFGSVEARQKLAQRRAERGY